MNVHCKGWTSSSAGDFGRVGLSTATNNEWTDPANPATASCSTFHHLYCIEDIL
ncbi:hypothetical protein [Nannocystis pusilla]|uniref:hypothetical protein n=1 Tax=Nannocystis pusilla TaxID=889268 RepID=UPI003B7D6767